MRTRADDITCECCTPATTRDELRQRHGTPETFERSVRAAIGEISVDEAEAAIDAYRTTWRLAPVGEVPRG